METFVYKIFVYFKGPAMAEGNTCCTRDLNRPALVTTLYFLYELSSHSFTYM